MPVIEPPSVAENMHDRSSRQPLADVRDDMVKIFGDARPSITVRASRAIRIPIMGAASGSLGNRTISAGRIVAAAAATGLLISIAAVGGLYLAESRDRMIPAPANPATGVVASPFERSAEPPPKQRSTPAVLIAIPRPIESNDGTANRNR